MTVLLKNIISEINSSTGYHPELSAELSKAIEDNILSNNSIEYFEENNFWIKINNTCGDSYKYQGIILKNTKRIKHLNPILYANVLNKNILGFTLGNSYFGIITPILTLKHEWEIISAFKYKCKCCDMRGIKKNKYIIPDYTIHCKNKVILDIID